MIAYKLLRVRKDGSLGPLFINRSQVIPTGKWLPARAHKTPGFAFRPGWHALSKPEAPHLSLKGRKWFVVKVDDYETHHRPASQGGKWFLAKRMMVVRPLSPLAKTVNCPRRVSFFYPWDK